MWLHSTRAEDLASIQCVYVNRCDGVDAKEGERKVLTFSLGTRLNGSNTTAYVFSQSWSGVNRTTLKKAMSKIGHNISSRKKAGGMEKEDFFELRKAIEMSLR